MRLTTVILATLALCGCEAWQRPATTSPTVTISEPAPAAVGFAAAWDRRPEGPTWSRLTLQALDDNGRSLVTTRPSDALEFCPAFDRLDRDGRRAFYLALMSRMAQYESSFDTTTEYEESFADSQGRPVISRGLLQ